MRTHALIVAALLSVSAVAGSAAAHGDGHGVVQCALDTGVGPCNGETFTHQVVGCAAAPLEGDNVVTECVAEL